MLHADEVPIDAAVARRLVRTQFPAWAHLPLRRARSQGTDNVVFRLGDEMSVRLPRKPSAVPSLLIESEWLPWLAPQLPLSVPTPVAAGDPAEGYPFPWAVCRWVGGVTPPEPRDLDSSTPRRLGEFVVALQAVDTTGGPLAGQGTNRGGPLTGVDDDTREALARVTGLMSAGRLEPDLLDPTRAEEVWRAALDAPGWDRPGVWLHRDLHCANLVATEHRLTGVIDFGGLIVGDPAGDLMAAWHVLRPAERSMFKAIVGADNHTWARARGWALSQGLLALPYYLDTHPGMVAMARRAVTQALSDS